MVPKQFLCIRNKKTKQGSQILPFKFNAIFVITQGTGNDQAGSSEI